MIEVINDIIKELASIREVDGRVYRSWPRKTVDTPAIMVSRISASTIQSEADGSEISARLTYSIDIVCSGQSELDGIAEQAADILARFNFQRTGQSDYFDDQHKTYRTILTVSGAVDKRGNTYTD